MITDTLTTSNFVKNDGSTTSKGSPVGGGGARPDSNVDKNMTNGFISAIGTGVNYNPSFQSSYVNTENDSLGEKLAYWFRGNFNDFKDSIRGDRRKISVPIAIKTESAIDPTSIMLLGGVLLAVIFFFKK